MLSSFEDHVHKICALFVVSLSGCAKISDQARFEPNADTLTIARSVPNPSATGIHPNSQVDLCVSGLVDPRSVGDLDAALGSGARRFDNRLDVQLFAWRGPGGTPPEPDAPWCPGSVLSILPAQALEPGVLYRVRLSASVVGWAGESFDTSVDGWTVNSEGEPVFDLEFTVADNVVPSPSPRPKRGDIRLFDLFEPGQVFDPKRNACSCHQTPATVANALLDLSAPAPAFAALTLPGRARDTGFPMITPLNPSESFLLHKLLRTSEGGRLRGLLGDAMPPDHALPYRDLVAIARWIETGARL